VKPAEKAAVVERQQSQSNGQTVMFIGDGINDLPALAQADVGVAIGAGTDIAVETAGVVLMKADLTDVLTAIDLSQCTLNRIRWNFWWAVIYNLISIPLAAGLFYPLLHMTVPPVLAAAAMGCSSISVVLSSLWLKRYHKPTFDELDGTVPPRGARTRRTGGREYVTVLSEDDELDLQLDDMNDTHQIQLKP